MGGGRVIELRTKEEWDNQIASAKNDNKVVIVDFSAVWCGPCNMIGPYFGQLSEKYPSIVFVKIDVDVNQAVASACGVSAMPTFQVWVNGAKVEDMVGAVKEKLEKLTLAELGIEIHRVPRGGETTYHGPGQLVAYPIFDLRQLGVGPRAFVEGLEDALIQTVGCFGIQARGRVPGKTGVWVGERKIGAVGIRITHGISSHGVALNVSTNLGHYKHIVPCGTPDKEVTSLSLELLRHESSDLCRNNKVVSSSDASVSDNSVTQCHPPVSFAAVERCFQQGISRVFGFAGSEIVTALKGPAAIFEDTEVYGVAGGAVSLNKIK
eukprot:gene3811-4068_t